MCLICMISVMCVMCLICLIFLWYNSLDDLSAGGGHLLHQLPRRRGEEGAFLEKARGLCKRSCEHDATGRSVDHLSSGSYRGDVCTGLSASSQQSHQSHWTLSS